MSCACHGKNGEQVNGTVFPEDQCVVCAAKHLAMARAAWGEFTYELVNRFWCAGHIRLAVEHLKIDNKEFALKLRDLAVAIENVQDIDKSDIRDRFGKLTNEMLALLIKNRPIITINLSKLAD